MDMGEHAKAINDILAHGGIRSAYIYVGSHNKSFRCRPDGSKPDPSKFDEQTGAISYQTGIDFNVNPGRKSHKWKFFVTYEPDDTLTVRLLRVFTKSQWMKRKDGKMSLLLSESSDVYKDNLAAIVESMYDNALKEHGDGFIYG